MKKKLNPAAMVGKKLRLNKKTISNLNEAMMNTNHMVESGATKNGITCFTHRCRPSW